MHHLRPLAMPLTVLGLLIAPAGTLAATMPGPLAASSPQVPAVWGGTGAHATPVGNGIIMDTLNPSGSEETAIAVPAAGYTSLTAPQPGYFFNDALLVNPGYVTTLGEGEHNAPRSPGVEEPAGTGFTIGDLAPASGLIVTDSGQRATLS